MRKNNTVSKEMSSDDILLLNLHQLMERHNVTEAELARRTKIPQPTVHKILSGKTEDPRISTLQAIASFFDVTVDQLYSLGAKVDDKIDLNVQSVPIISWGECLKGNDFFKSLTSTIWPNWLVIEDTGKYLYGLVSKPSMEPRFPKGTTLIIDPCAIPTDGDLVVVHYPNTNEATLRELSIDGPVKLLLPVNSLSGQEPLTEEVEILGTVIQSRFNY